MNTRDRIAEALAQANWNETGISVRATRDADALLPVVEQIATERAAEELLDAADRLWSGPEMRTYLRSRAAGLTDKDSQR